jgi:hypothetical protein
MVRAYPWHMVKNECPIWNKLAEQIRREPMKAVLLAFGGGLILCLLPVGKLLGFLVKMTFVLSKPALLILGVVKLLEYSGFTGE